MVAALDEEVELEAADFSEAVVVDACVVVVVVEVELVVVVVEGWTTAT